VVTVFCQQGAVCKQVIIKEFDDVHGRSGMVNVNSYWGGIKQESPCLLDTGFLIKIGHRPTLPHFTAVPSALAGLTSLFGMGRGGHRRYRHLNIL
jgi:hypothetical protein